jgi:aspartate kinase
LTDNTYREAAVDWSKTEEKIRAELPSILDEYIVITQGFLGSTSENFTTTLGREGSDYSAAIFASCLNAENVTIWKDVPGVLNADPKWFEKNRIDSRTILYGCDRTYLLWCDCHSSEDDQTVAE